MQKTAIFKSSDLVDRKPEYAVPREMNRAILRFHHDLSETARVAIAVSNLATKAIGRLAMRARGRNFVSKVNADGLTSWKRDLPALPGVVNGRLS